MCVCDGVAETVVDSEPLSDCVPDGEGDPVADGVMLCDADSEPVGEGVELPLVVWVGEREPEIV